MGVGVQHRLGQYQGLHRSIAFVSTEQHRPAQYQRQYQQQATVPAVRPVQRRMVQRLYWRKTALGCYPHRRTQYQQNPLSVAREGPGTTPSVPVRA
eukprot:1515069-Rhodomonas_salina.1